MTTIQHTCVVRVDLFLFLNDVGYYKEYGSVCCAIAGTVADPPVYKMGCYNEKNEYVCTANITTNNETGACIALQPGSYVSFKDELGKTWSMQFETDSHAIEFCAHIVVAMYGASGYPEKSILACDVLTGKSERSVFANDTIKVRFQSWVVQFEDNRGGLPSLGSKLDGNLSDEKPFTLVVPANHISVTPAMKGFEGMLIGMGEGGSRLIVIPSMAKRGGGPHVHMCFYSHIVKKKDYSQPTKNTADSGGMIVKNSDPYVGEYKVLPSTCRTSDTILRPKSPPPGFSSDQLLIVDRLRDQVYVLSQQLHEARRQLDVFMNDIRSHEQHTRPQSLATAQLEYSIQKLLVDTEEKKELLKQKDTALRQLEDKNKDLLKKVEKFNAAANLLAEEKKTAITSANEEKLDMDRRIAQAQAQLTQLQSEREDVARHLSTVKRLIQVADQDVKSEKQSLQLALIAFQTNESKLAVAEENFAEETARRRILESKAAGLGDQLRAVLEEIRVKEGLIEERRRKIESDKLHYIQLIEDERSKAAEDIRELRQELIDELASRDRRYQEERQRVSLEAFERGRLQGVEDGHAEVLLETDGATQEMAITIQRRTAEVNAIRIRLKTAKEQNEADERRLSSQATTLREVLATLEVENSHMNVEMNSLRDTVKSVEEETVEALGNAFRCLSHPISRKDLLTVIHSLRIKKDIDYGFDIQYVEQRQKVLDQERGEVCKWVAGCVEGLSVPFPPMRSLCAIEPPVSYLSDVAMLSDKTGLPDQVVEPCLHDEMSRQETFTQFDPDEIERRYNELLSELTSKTPLDPQPITKNGLLVSHTCSSLADDLPCVQLGEAGGRAIGKQRDLALEAGVFLTQRVADEVPLQLPQEGNGACPILESVRGRTGRSFQCAKLSLPERSIATETQTEGVIESTAVTSGVLLQEQHCEKKNEVKVPLPPNRGLQKMLVRWPTLVDSDCDGDSVVASNATAVRSRKKTVWPKKSLFDDSDFSDEKVF